MARKLVFSFALLLSGLAGISYEILYGRMLGSILGDQFAVSSAILITFLLGIGIGSKYAHRLWRHLWLIEALIGIYGIAFALGQEAIDHLLYHGLGFVPGIGGSIFLCSLLLIFPAILIGCSVPLFAGYLGRMDEGPVFSRVYAIYNAGAFVTALLIEFWLIRQFGIRGTVMAFAALNLLVAVLLFFAARQTAQQVPENSSAAIVLPRHQIVSLILVSAASAVFQLFMVKTSEMMFGPFRETFALVLAIVLFGIAFGSFLVRRLNIGYSTLLLANIAGLLLNIISYEHLLYFYANLYRVAVMNGVAIIFLKGGVLFALMGIPAITFGATVPALLKSRAEVAEESGALLYVSSLANVAGFLLMALVLHRYLDYGVQLLAVTALSAAALVANAEKRARIGVAAAALALAAVGLHRWKWDENLLYLSYTSFQSPIDLKDERAEFEFPDKFKGYQDVFAITWIGGRPYFFINGYISFPLNNPSEKIVGLAGSMFAPRTGDALVLGLGSGTTASAVGLVFDHTDTVEINPVVRENLHRMKEWNFDIEHNPKVNIIVDDAIHYAKASAKDYDMVLNTVTSPLYFSSAKLYTHDFFAAVKKRLRPDGVYVAWMDSRIGIAGAEIVIKTLGKSYKHVALLFIKASYYLLIASDQPVRLHHPDLADKGMPLKMDLMANHTRVPRLLAYNLMTTDALGLVRDSTLPVNTLDRPSLEFEIAKLKKSGFEIFKLKMVKTLTLDDVRAAIEPAMKYDPAEHVAHVKRLLKESTITDRFTQQGNIYVKNFGDRMDAAALDVYRVIAKEVNDASARHNFGYQLMNRGDYREALAEFNAALKLEPGHRNTLFNMGACYEYQDKFAQAIEHYEAEGKLYPKDADVPYRLARVYRKMGKYETALAMADHALAMRKNVRTHTLRAKILENLGRKNEAVEAYQNALALEPANTDLQATLNKYLAKW